MSHLDLAEFRRFYKENNNIFTFNMVLTLFTLLYSLENKQSNKANVKHIEDVHVSLLSI